MRRANRHFLPGHVWQITRRVKTRSEAIAVDSLSFVQKVKSELGFKAAHREVMECGGTYVLRSKAKLTTPILPVKVRR
jgi:hypothetical protein